MKYKIFADCLPVKGYLRSCIYDLTRGRFEFIPNELCDFLLSKYDDLAKELIDVFGKKKGTDYLNWLLKQDLIYSYTDADKNAFNPINVKKEQPFKINNAIVDIDQSTDLKLIIKELETVGCPFLQLRFKKEINLIELKKTLLCIHNSRIRSVEVIIPFTQDWQLHNKNAIKEIFLLFPRMLFLQVYQAPNKQLVHLEVEKASRSLSYTPTDLFEHSDSTPSPGSLMVNLDLYLESLSYNTFYNKKIFIESNGQVWPGQKTNSSYGNLFEEPLSIIIEKNGFNSNWAIHKDLVMVCRDCEFRYMCIDSRLPQKHRQGNWLLEKECNYNPYIAKWKGDDGYVPLDISGITYDKNTFHINKNKLDAIVSTLWS